LKAERQQQIAELRAMAVVGVPCLLEEEGGEGGEGNALFKKGRRFAGLVTPKDKQKE